MISVIIPVFNEEESLSELYKEIKAALKKENLEIIFIDDGSLDKSLEILKKIASKDKDVKVFSFRKNLGKAEALTLGFQKAKGEYIVTLDADLQDRPSEIKKLFEKEKNGWDLVSGWRKNRKDSLTKVLSSKLFNSLATFFWGLKINDLNSGLKLYRRDVAKTLNLYGGMHRFIPLLVYQQGFRVTEVAVVHDKRKFGKSKYRFTKIFTEIPDMFTMLFLSKYSLRPLHLFGWLGFILLSIGLVILIYLTILHFQGFTIGDRPLLLFGFLLVLSGFQIFLTGFLADLFLHFSKNDNGKEIILKYQKE
jgi:glycosyltransferase involved in cell wall biosynthesis